jgi:hypothetical protein
MPLCVFGDVDQQATNRCGESLASDETLRFEIRSNKATDTRTRAFDADGKVPQQQVRRKACLCFPRQVSQLYLAQIMSFSVGQ